MVFSAMLSEAYWDSDHGIHIKHRTDGKLFNLHILQALIKVKETVLRDFLFDDDCIFNAGSEPEMQAVLEKFSTAGNNFGLTISTKKTEVMHQPVPN